MRTVLYLIDGIGLSRAGSLKERLTRLLVLRDIEVSEIVELHWASLAGYSHDRGMFNFTFVAQTVAGLFKAANLGVGDPKDGSRSIGGQIQDLVVFLLKICLFFGPFFYGVILNDLISSMTLPKVLSVLTVPQLPHSFTIATRFWLIAVLVQCITIVGCGLVSPERHAFVTGIRRMAL